jgi:exodeoxyribonuclease-3
MDFEGRVIRADFDECSVISMYLPSGTNLDRLEYKFQFMDEMRTYLEELKKQIPNLIVCGDYNICHKAIDIHDPVRNKKVSGFLPEERAWMDQLINQGFIDSFRELNQEPHQYSWWSYRANSRANNKGWRLDYAMVTKSLQEKISRAYILSEAHHSDHCPVAVELDFNK